MKIVTAVVNNTNFIEIQYHTLKKYFKGDYEFIVFNDAKNFPDYTNDNDITIKTKIEETCEKLNIKCINIPNEHHITEPDPATRCAESMNYILNYQIQNPDKYLLLDSDMFLIDYFDIDKYSNYDSAIVLQSRQNGEINYFWNGIYYFDIMKMKDVQLLNWNCSNACCDTGGMTQEWLRNQMDGKTMPNTDEIRWNNIECHTNNIYFIRHLWSCSWNESEIPENIKHNNAIIDFLKNDKRNNNDKFFCEIYDDVFLHYRAGGNWLKEGMEFHKKHSEALKEVLLENI